MFNTNMKVGYQGRDEMREDAEKSFREAGKGKSNSYSHGGSVKKRDHMRTVKKMGRSGKSCKK